MRVCEGTGEDVCVEDVVQTLERRFHVARPVLGRERNCFFDDASSANPIYNPRSAQLILDGDIFPESPPNVIPYDF